MIRNQSSELTVRPKRSSSTIMLMVVGGLLTLAVVAYFSYFEGVKKGYQDFESDKILLQQLSKSVNESRTELSTVQQDLVFAQRQQQIQEEAYKQLNKAYANSEEKNSVLRSQLSFYRSIISPEDGQTGPAIQSLVSSYEEGQLSFDIKLVQAINHQSQVQGALRVVLYQNEKVTDKWPLSSARSVNYQYFQQVSGTIEAKGLAADAKIKVELKLSSGTMVEQWYPLNIQSVE